MYDGFKLIAQRAHLLRLFLISELVFHDPRYNLIDFRPEPAIHGHRILHQHLSVLVGPGSERHGAAVDYGVGLVVGFQDFEVLPWGESIILNLQLQFVLILLGSIHSRPPIGILAHAVRTLARILHADAQILPEDEVLYHAVASLALNVGFGLAVHLIPPSQKLINLQIGHLLHLGTALVFDSGVEPDEHRNERDNEAPEAAGLEKARLLFGFGGLSAVLGGESAIRF